MAVSGPIADIWCWAETDQAVGDAVLNMQNLLNEGAEVFEPILTEIAESIPMISALFEIDLGTPDDIQHTLHKVKEVLLNTTGAEW